MIIVANFIAWIVKNLRHAQIILATRRYAATALYTNVSDVTRASVMIVLPYVVGAIPTCVMNVTKTTFYKIVRMTTVGIRCVMTVKIHANNAGRYFVVVIALLFAALAIRRFVGSA